MFSKPHHSRSLPFPPSPTNDRAVLFALVAAAIFGALAAPHALLGHGFEGDRFFPPTIQTDDPFATDELSLPTVSVFNNPAGDGSPKTRETDIVTEFDKEIFPGFALRVLLSYTVLQPCKGDNEFQTPTTAPLSAKYQLWQSPQHEFIFSVGMEWEIGGSGRSSLTSNSSTLSPNIFFGKGFGDLPDSLQDAQPATAITGHGVDMPVRSLDPNVLEWGIALEYSLPYLEQHVKDTGLPHPFRDMIPLVEFSMETPLNRGGGWTTGTINPGVLWEGKYCQIGAEAVIPMNKVTGPNVGVVFNVQIFIDDLLPKVFGHPIFGGGGNTLTSGSGK